MTDKEMQRSAYEKAKIELKELRERMEFSNIVRTNSSTDNLLESCSFCGKSANERETLIEGPAVFICNVCVRLCQDILNAKGIE